MEWAFNMSGASKSKKIVGEFLILSVPLVKVTNEPIVGSVSSRSICKLFAPDPMSASLLLSSVFILTYSTPSGPVPSTWCPILWSDLSTASAFMSPESFRAASSLLLSDPAVPHDPRSMSVLASTWMLTKPILVSIFCKGRLS